MYRFSDFMLSEYSPNKENFMNLLKTKWDDMHNESGIFRYKISNIHQKILGGKYLIQLNPDRSTNRRTPEHINNICQPFDTNKFNFTKVSHKEIICTIEDKGDEHSVMVNVSPISRYHSLLCPSVNQKLPQVATAGSLTLALRIMFLTEDCYLKLGFNSLCAFASVNHLHYHLFIEKHSLPIESTEWKQLVGPLHYTENYPVPAFCFEVVNDVQNQVEHIHKLLKYFIDNEIAHNILMTRRASKVAVYVWPRKSTVGVKLLHDFNVAVCELSGWFPVYTSEAYENLKPEDLETELMKWKLNSFQFLCNKVKLLYQ